MDYICEPKIIAKEMVYESPYEYSVDVTRNCNICDDDECPYYKEYH